MSYFKSLCMFFTSFFPLWVAILFIDIKSIIENQVFVITEWISIACIVLLFLVSVITLYLSFKFAKKKKQKIQRYYLVTVNKQKSITAEFVLTYIVPLIAFDFTHWEGALLFSFFFILLSILCAKNRYFSVNVLLELIGYRFFICVLKNIDNQNIEKTIISKNSLPSIKGDAIHLSEINNEYSLEVESIE